MRRLMEYHIISGNVVETRRSYLPMRSVRKTRGVRRAGTSSARKISQNEKQEILRLARQLNANFYRGGYLVTFKYGPERLPESYEQLCKNGQGLMKKLGAMCRKQGAELKRVLVNANWSPAKDRPARLHHHVVMNEIDLSLLSSLWPEGELDIRRLRHGDLTALADYLYRNVKTEPGKKHWSPSRNLEKPILTEPVPVHGTEMEAPAGATEIYQQPTYDEDGRQVGSYLRCTLPEPPKFRGGQIILPRPQKRGGRKT